jgi:glycosyltransferase involved in cell wall biosynthesis
MKKVLFYIYSNWVFGKIHYDLARVLYPEYSCDVRCWTTQISETEAPLVAEKYDLFVTTPEGGINLLRHGIAPEKIIVIAHSDWDIFYPVESKMCDVTAYNVFRKYGVICPLLQHISFTYNIARVPEVIPVGLFCDNYTRPASTGLKTLGYFGKYNRSHRDNKTDIKRGYLAEQVAQATGLTLYREEGVHFTATEGLYKRADLVMFCSLIEGNPYVALESFAAGVPVLGTGTGIFAELARTGGGGVLPFNEKDFVHEAVEVINALHENWDLYTLMRSAALEAVKTYDWSVLRPQWLNFLSA